MSQMFLKGTASAVPFVWCAEHVQQPGVGHSQKKSMIIASAILSANCVFREELHLGNGASRLRFEPLRFFSSPTIHARAE
jgi:hypothetical protein